VCGGDVPPREGPGKGAIFVSKWHVLMHSDTFLSVQCYAMHG